MNWLNSEAFTLLGQHIKWSDMIGNVIGLTALAFGWRRSIWSWPVQFLSGVVLFAAFATAHLSGSAGKQVVVMVVAVYGWWQWKQGTGRTEDGHIAVPEAPGLGFEGLNDDVVREFADADAGEPFGSTEAWDRVTAHDRLWS